MESRDEFASVRKDLLLIVVVMTVIIGAFVALKIYSTESEFLKSFPKSLADRFIK